MFYVYLLKSCKYKEFYIGSTNNLIRRLAEHNKGRVTSTKRKCPFTLIYYEAYKVESDARRRESMLKLRGQARRQLLSRLKDTLENNISVRINQ